MSFTKEQKEIISDYFKKLKIKKCSVCSSKPFEYSFINSFTFVGLSKYDKVNKKFILNNESKNEPLKINTDIFPTISIVCKKCGNTISFKAEKFGLL